MFNEKNPQIEKIIDQLGSMLDLCYVFESQLRCVDMVKPIIIILHQGDHNSFTEDMDEKIKSLFKTAHLYTFKIFGLDYALTSLKEHNLFFIQHCQKENIIYKLKCANPKEIQMEINEVTFELIREHIDDQLSSCVHYFDAALEFKEEANYVKALVNLNIYHKSLMDIAAKFHLGHEFEATQIRELQELMAPFNRELGAIYDIHSKEDWRLLKLLDQISEHSIIMTSPINEEQIEALINKASQTLDATLNLFRNQHKAAKISYERSHKIRPLSQPKTSKEYQKIREDVQALVNRKILELRPGHNKTYYKANMKIDGPADILYHISGMLKVSIMALGNENSNLFPNPNLNIQTTLEHVLQLLPFEEVECLERIIKELKITTDHYVLEPPRYLYA